MPRTKQAVEGTELQTIRPPVIVSVKLAGFQNYYTDSKRRIKFASTADYRIIVVSPNDPSNYILVGLPKFSHRQHDVLKRWMAALDDNKTAQKWSSDQFYAKSIVNSSKQVQSMYMTEEGENRMQQALRRLLKNAEAPSSEVARA